MSYPNVYYSPESFGLEIVLEVEQEPCYDFHKFVVWRHLETDHYFFATDSGCSCPSPFEDYSSIGDLTEVESAQQLHDALDEMAYDPIYGTVDGKWQPTGERELAHRWDAGEVAEGHYKISQLRIHPVIQGTLAHIELEAA